jgi:hypothetical protein
VSSWSQHCQGTGERVTKGESLQDLPADTLALAAVDRVVLDNEVYNVELSARVPRG